MLLTSFPLILERLCYRAKEKQFIETTANMYHEFSKYKQDLE